MNPGDAAFAGQNKPAGAAITYSLIPSEKKTEEAAPAETAAGAGGFGGREAGRMPGGPVKITILDTNGKFVSQFSGPDNKGINRVRWNFRETEEPTPQEPQEAGQQTEARGAGMSFGRAMGVMVLPGTYTARVRYDDQELIQSFQVQSDPRLKVDPEVLKANYDKAKQAQNLSRVVMRAGRQLQQTQRAIQTVKEDLKTGRNPKAADLQKAADDLEKKLKELTETLNTTPAKQGMADRSASLQSQVTGAVMGISQAGIEPVSQAAQVRYDKVVPKVQEFLARFNDFYEKDVEAFKKLLKEADFSLFGSFTALRIE
jgi:tetrahydromethanopterin S-methyltransferase subunit B